MSAGPSSSGLSQGAAFESGSAAALARLKGVYPQEIDLSLDRVWRLLAALGDPQAALPPVVHVAGTNGKGSVVAFLRAILEAAGLRVHVYTSPHLVRFHERIRLAGALVGEAQLTAVLEEVEAAMARSGPVTFFESTTAAAFLAMARTPADVTLLEVGLGGRLDATNVVDRPALTAITPVSMDHMAFLGDTLAKIAFEKAGILKPGVPGLIGRQERAAAAVVDRQAAAVGAPLLRLGTEWAVEPGESGFVLRDGETEIALPAPSLAGAHQVDNAAHAALLARRLPGFAIPEAAIAAGVQRAEWPARMQRLTHGPLADALGPGWQLWLDGGHNAQAGAILKRELAGWAEPLDLVYGMLNTKAAADFLRPLAPRVRRLRAVAIPGEADSLSPEEAAAHARAQGIEAAPAPDVASAVAELRDLAETPGRLLICGSLYLAGSVLAENG